MPYIDNCTRKYWDLRIKKITYNIGCATPGDMNYIITKLLLAWVKDSLKYVKICMVMGTLICVMFEFYRRIATPYENLKIKLNGDVYNNKKEEANV